MAATTPKPRESEPGNARCVCGHEERVHAGPNGAGRIPPNACAQCDCTWFKAQARTREPYKRDLTRPFRLTPSEENLIKAMWTFDNLTMAELAVELAVEESTLHGRLTEIYDKWDIKNQRALMKRAIEEGIIQL